MKRYSCDELSCPETYSGDPDLARLCRQAINARFTELGYPSRAVAREAVYAGNHPEWVAALVEDVVSAQEIADALSQRNREVVAGVTPPAGYSLEVDGDEILVRGPYSRDLHERIKRQKGYWEGKSSGKRRECLVVPLASAKSLKRIFGNSTKAGEEKKVAVNIAEINRWLGYVENKALEGWVYERGVQECRSLRIGDHPEFAARLEAAISKAQAIRAERQKREADEREQERSRREFQRAERAQRTHKPRDLYPVSRRPPLNVPVRHGKSVVVYESYGQSFRISEDHPSMYGSHLLGYEGEAGCYCYYREATAAEVEDLDTKEAARKTADEKQAAARTTLREIAGRMPVAEGLHSFPTGERFLDTLNIYGDGECWVINQDDIWYIRNNGADGDDWSTNNIRTGGAGAIGYRMPYDAVIAQKVRQAAVTLKDIVRVRQTNEVLYRHLDQGEREI